MIEPIERYEHAGVVVEIVPDTDPTNDPQDNDNAGTIYSWTYRREFDGDEYIGEPEIGLDDRERAELAELEIAFNLAGGRGADLAEEIDELRSRENLAAYMARNYDAALTIPLRFSDYGSSGARIYETSDDDDANCAICFTQEEIDREWSGHIEPYNVQMRTADGALTGEVREYGGARGYAEARINELDQWMQGDVFGIVIRALDGEPTEDLEHVAGEVLESVWGFIGDWWDPKTREWIMDEANEMAEAAREALDAEERERLEWAARDVETV